MPVSHVLDLSVTFTPPPVDAGPSVLASIALRCDALGLSHPGGLLTDPLTKQEREDLQWYLEEYWQWPYEGFLSRGKQIEALLPEIGKRLYKSLFGSVEADRIVQKWLAEPETRGPFQLSLISDLPAALSLPWELLHSEQGYLALRTRRPISIVRRLPQNELTSDQTTTFTPPLRILLVTARPEGAGFVDPRSIARELLDEVQEAIDAGSIAVEFLRPPTLSALQERLRDTKRLAVHILHFDGHGVFGNGEQGPQADPHLLQGGGQGMLAFETEEGTLDLVKAEDLAQTLQDSQVQLAVLTACQSATGDGSDVWSSVAARLIQGGINAVSAMSASVLVVSAARYTEAFYKELAAGAQASLAQERARQSLYTNARRHTVSRDRSEEGAPVELRDWWLPHFYQQVPLLLQPMGKKKTIRSKVATQETRPVLSAAMPPSPRYGFSGRSRELLHLERWLGQDKLVVIHGFGGMGKTALAREAADWFTRTGMYQGACFVSFGNGQGTASVLLSQVGFLLGVYDGTYSPDDAKKALVQLQAALKQQRVLVIADNLESILPGGEAPLTGEERAELWNVLLELQRLGAGVLLTTRTTAFGDGRLSEGKQVVYLPLGRLGRDDAYQLASSMLSSLRIDRRRGPYQQLRELLFQLGHHPLSIQLVLPALRTYGLAQIQQDFVALLPQFEDDAEMGRNRSLLASLEYSLRRLSEEQRGLLLRLAVFEGGANEKALLEITRIPAKTWATLRPALEQAALLVAEPIHQAISVPFLHFHPVLVPYLRQQAIGQEDEAQRQRYASYYATLAYSLEVGVYQNPEVLYALGWRELPNLRTAMTCLLQVGDSGAASLMASWLTKFLTHQGLIRERDRLRQRVDQLLGTSVSEELTIAAYSYEIDRASDELCSGKIQVALARLTKLLARIQVLPDGGAIGSGSYAHSNTLHLLGQCLFDAGQYPDAWQHFQRALGLLNAQLEQEPESRILRIAHANLLGGLGCVLREWGDYSQARAYFEQDLQEHRAVQDTLNEAPVLGELGTTALLQQDYTQARSYYQQALQQFQAMGNLEEQAGTWHQLGMVAQEQRDWSEAERCYRESLTLTEHIGYTAGAAGTCNQLAFVAESAGRPVEAVSWFKGALERIKRVEPGGVHHAQFLNNLTSLLVKEVQAGRAERTRLTEARSYLEQCRHIAEQAGLTGQTERTYNLLARIAELEEQPGVARDYRRRERESFAASANNRFQIDQRFGKLFPRLAVAQDDLEVRVQMEELLSEAEANGWHISEALHRIWAGERDWQTLVENLGNKEALFVMRVLETLAQSAETTTNARSQE